MNNEYKNKLLKMRDEDIYLSKECKDPHILFVKDESLIKLRKENTEKLKELVSEFGFPTISLVGQEAHAAAFYLFNRSINDVTFIGKLYKDISKLPSSEINLIEYAFLEDKLNFYVGKPQVYGTQFYHDDEGNFIPWTILNEEEVEQRRKEIGLNSLKDQIENNKKNRCKRVVKDEVLQLREKRNEKLKEIGWIK